MTRNQYYQNYLKYLEYQKTISKWQGLVLLLCLLLTGIGAWWIMVRDPSHLSIVLAVLVWFSILTISLVIGRVKAKGKWQGLNLVCTNCKQAYTEAELVNLAFTGACPRCKTPLFVD